MKTKTSIKKLGAAIALALASSAASATVLYDTHHYLFNPDGSVKGVSSGDDTLLPSQWVAAYFFVNSAACPAGCDLDQATVLLAEGSNSPAVGLDLSGYSLEIWSDKNTPTNIGRNSQLFSLTSPTNVFLNGDFGTDVTFTATAQDPNASALLQPNTPYWLVLTNDNQFPPVGWFYNGVQAGEYWQAYYDETGGSGSPYIFSVEGTARVAHTPIPGAVWMMGAGLVGLMGARRKVSE